MATRRVLENQQTIKPGNSSTSSTIDLKNEESLTLQAQGDGNSTNLKFTLECKIDGLDEWSQLDQLKNVDLTDNETNDNKVFQYDVLDLERFRVKTENNAADTTTLDLLVSFTDQQ